MKTVDTSLLLTTNNNNNNNNTNTSTNTHDDVLKFFDQALDLFQSVVGKYMQYQRYEEADRTIKAVARLVDSTESYYN